MTVVPPPKKDWFVYLMLYDRLLRLNIDELCKSRRSPNKPVFEVVQEFSSAIPVEMRHIIVGSKVYMVGGKVIKPFDANSMWRSSSCPNLDVYSFDPEAEVEAEAPLIRLCKDPNIPSRLIDPRLTGKTKSIVFTLEDKIYLLATGPYLKKDGGHDYNYNYPNPHDESPLDDDDDEPPPLFRVFDPIHQSWKHLPHPPCYDDESLRDRYRRSQLCDHCVWGNKLLIHTIRGSYIFDTHDQEKWEDVNNIGWDSNEQCSVVAELEQGFLIGMPVGCKNLVAYHLDPNGIPKPYRVLHELEGIFCPFLLISNCFLGKCDGGRMWLTYSGKDLMEFHYTRVAVFRVSISNDLAGKPVLSAEVEAAEFYYLEDESPVFSAFALCHHLNKHDIEEKIFYGAVVPHDH